MEKVAYMLKLPERIKFQLTFHVNCLKPYYENPNIERVQIKQVSSLFMKQFDREMEKILDH